MDEREILSKFYREIYGTDKGKDIKEMFQTDITKVKTISDVLECYKKYEVYVILGRPLGTIKNLINDFKKIINEAQNLKHKELFLIAFSLPSGYYHAINQASSKVVEERREQGANINISVKEFDILIDDLYTKGMDKDISFWNKGIGSRQTKEGIRAYYLASYLALATGRRLTEILKTLELKKYRDSVKAKGILKKRGTEEKESKELFVLDGAEKITTALRELRKIFDATKFSNRECNSKFNGIFNNFLKENIFEGATFHELRSIYGEIAFAKVGTVQNIEKKDFISSVLLQEVEGVKAVDFYLNRAKVIED